MKDFHYKLDRSAFQALTFEEADKQMKSSVGVSLEERINHFNYIMSVAYAFLGEQWPEMEKSAFEKIKRP